MDNKDRCRTPAASLHAGDSLGLISRPERANGLGHRGPRAYQQRRWPTPD